MAEVRLSEAATILGVSVATVWRRLRKGEIQGRRGPDGHWLVFVPDPAAEDDQQTSGNSIVEAEGAATHAELAQLRALLAELQRQREDLVRQLDAATVERSEIRNLLAQALQKLPAAPAQGAVHPRDGLDRWAIDRHVGDLSSPGLRTAQVLLAIVFIVDLLVARSPQVPIVFAYALPPILAVRGGSRPLTLLVTVLTLAAFAIGSLVHRGSPFEVGAGLLVLTAIGYLAVSLTRRQPTVAGSSDEVTATVPGMTQPIARVAEALDSLVGPLFAYAKLLRNQLAQHEDPDLIRQAREVEHAADRLRRFVDDLRDVVHSEQGRLEVKSGWVDLATLVQEVVAQERPIVPTRELAVVVPNRLDGPWDPSRMRQLIGGLLAWATAEVEGTGKIEVEVRAFEDHAAIRVSRPDRPDWTDSLRVLLTAEDWNRWTAERCPVRIAVGLLVGRAVVEAYGGRVWFDQEHASGTTIRLRLPTRGPGN